MNPLIDDDNNDNDDNQPCFHGHEQAPPWLPIGSTRQTR
jgi:hypothetical protein